MNGSPAIEPRRCAACGALLVGEACAVCGYEPAPASSKIDPLIGRTIADRYEITKLINVGGMGRVYKATQRSLQRDVAIKFIHPHLATSDLSVQRFMTEAKAASRLNHPHVVTIFDYGRTADSEGALLFLVMELLEGPDLVRVMRGEGPLTFERIAMVLGQTLEALGEAHRLGITHRDIKPDNIMLMPRRKGRDQVKVIDFGTARMMQGAARITQVGNTCGTPSYMAPEQGSGGALGPWTDIYSVGVMMFEMLTGKLPFTGPTAVSVLLLHMTSPRPDPRVVAPERNIPDSLAEVCLKAIEIEAAGRFESAEEFSEDLSACMASISHGASYARWTTDSVVSRTGSAPPRSPPSQREEIETLPNLRPFSGAQSPARTAPTAADRAPEPERDVDADPSFLGRERDVAWALDLLTKSDVPAIAFWGRAGVGRTRLLQNVTIAAEDRGALLVRIPLAPAPRCIIGYSGLRAMVTRLSALTANDLLSGRVTGTTNPHVARGLRVVFGDAPGRLPPDPATVRAASAAALRWAMQRAIERSEAVRALLVIDDVDRLDGVSMYALDDVLQGESIHGFTVVVTSEQPRGGALGDRAHSRTLRGLSRTLALRMLANRRDAGYLARTDDDIEPLYIEQIARLKPAYEQAAPKGLNELAAWRVQGLPPPHRRLLQAVAVTGGGVVEQVKRMLSRPDEVDAAVQPLIDGGFVLMSERGIVLTHALLGRAAIASAPGGAIAELHEAAAEAISEQRGSVEVRAHHAINGRLDFQSFVLVEETAKLRTARGDRSGAITAFWEALGAARSQLMRGELELAPTAFTIFGRKLADALTEDDRLDEAKGILEEVLDVAAPMDANRAQVLEQLATIAELRGQIDEAVRRRHEAIDAAERCGDIDMAEGLRSLFAEPRAGRSRRAR